MNCEECTLRLWCVGILELQDEEGECIIPEEIAYLILNMWSVGDIKSYLEDAPGFNLPLHVRQTIVEKFYDYIYAMEGKILGLVGEIVKKDIEEGVIK